MTEVYLSYNNIFSSLGFDTETVVNNIHNQVSGLQLFVDQNLFSQPFCSSLINKKELYRCFS